MIRINRYAWLSVYLIIAAAASVMLAERNVAATARAAADSVVKPGDDDQDREERLALGKQSFQDNCLICHNEEMSSSQRLSAKQWLAEVDKMIGWGAPVPPEQKSALTEFLSGTYTETAPRQPLARMTIAQALDRLRPEPPARAAEPGAVGRGGALYAANCANCHGANARGADLGTNLVGRPVLFRASEFGDIVRKGRHRMPGFVQALSPAQESDILAWLLEQRPAVESAP
jgi:mono/diheme cytochrome c family protein